MATPNTNKHSNSRPAARPAPAKPTAVAAKPAAKPPSVTPGTKPVAAAKPVATSASPTLTPTPTKPPQPAAAPDADIDEDDLDGDGDDGDDGDGDDGDDEVEAKQAAPAPDAVPAKESKESTNEKYKKHLRSLPVAKRQAVLLGNLVERTQRQAAAVANWPGEAAVGIRAALAGALAGLKSAAEDLAQLPDDYKPRVPTAAKGGEKAELKAGDLVRITDKRKAEYDGILEPAQMRGIKVIEIRGNKVISTTSDGIKAMFARGHVCLDDGSPDPVETTDDTSTTTV